MAKNLRLSLLMLLVAVTTNMFAQFADGNYYLKNVESGRYLGAGNSWGTQASLTEHADYVTLASLGDGTYTIAGRVGNWLGANGYIDNGTAIPVKFAVSGDYYTISIDNASYLGYDGTTTVLSMTLTDSTALAAQWQLITREEMLKGLDAATADAPVDATFLIEDPNFSRQHDGKGYWEVNAYNFSLGGGAETNFCAESWHSTFTISQTLTGIPNGTYNLTAQGFYRQDTEDLVNFPVFFANEATTVFPVKLGTEDNMVDASNSFSAGNYTIEPIRVVVTDGTLQIGTRLENNISTWCIWDNFELTYCGPEVDIDVLNGLVETRDELVMDAIELYKNESLSPVLVDALKTAIAKADSSKIEASALNEVIAELNAAIHDANVSISNKTSIDAWFALAESTNVYTQEAYDSFMAIANEYLASWEANNLTETVVNPFAVQEWHYANIYDDFLLSSWTIDGKQTKDFETPFYVNTWSTEGETDGSDFKVPFYEYWVYENQTLGAATISATITGLVPRKMYTVSAWTRVRVSDAGSGTPTGATFKVGESSINACVGAQVGTSKLYLAEISATGTADPSGNLVISYVVSSSNNISWLSFKNVKYREALEGEVPDDTNVASMADLYGNYKFTADMMTVTEAGEALKEHFSDKCEVKVAKDESGMGWDAVISGIAGAVNGTHNVNGFDKENNKFKIQSWNGSNSSLWNGGLWMSNAEGIYPFGWGDMPILEELYFSYDPVTKIITIPDFTLVTVDHTTGSATIAASFKNAKLTLAESEDIPTEPELWATPKLSVKGSKLEDVVGQKVFLYNEAAGGFFRGLGRAWTEDGLWGARAGVSMEGADTVILQPALAENVAEGTAETPNTIWMAEWDNATYIFQNYTSHNVYTRWDEVWFGLTNYSTLWIDRQNDVVANENFFWNVEENENGTYSIKTSPKSTWLADQELYDSLCVKDSLGNVIETPAIKGGERLGIDLADANHAAYLEGYNNNAPLAYEWTIVSLADYASIDMNAYNAGINRYNAALELKAYIDEAKAMCPGIDVTVAEAVYENTESTLEELLVAKSSVTEAMLAYQSASATMENPTDMSFMIVNGTFDVIGDFTGWSGTTFGAFGEVATAAEHYEKTFDSYQRITGLPNGVYAVSVKGLYRAGNTDTDWMLRNDTNKPYVNLYARSGDASYSVALPNFADIAITDSYLGGVQISDTALYVPSNMVEFVRYKEAGYVNEVRVLVPVENGSLRIGVAKPSSLVREDWTIVDDFRLMYLGNSQEAYDSCKQQAVKNFPAIETIITDESVLYTESYRTAYEETLAAACEATSEELAAKVALVQPALDALRNNIYAYMAYQTKADKVLNDLSGTTFDETNADVVYIRGYFTDASAPGKTYPNGGHEYIINERTLTTAQLQEEVENLERWMMTAIQHGAVVGSDVTHMIVNPEFDGSFEGWTVNGSGILGNHNVEVYQGVVDVYQIVTGVPAGVYSISAQAFERPADNGWFDGTEETNVFIYMNDAKNPIMHIVDDAILEADAKDGVNCYIGDSTGVYPYDYNFNGSWIPNSVNGAYYAFTSGRYVNKCYGVVGDDGVMKIGLTSEGKPVHWTLWANFRMTFEGKNEEGMQAILEATVARALAYINDYAGEMTSPALTAIEDAIAKVDEAVDYETSYAAVHAINEALDAAHVNVEVYAACILAIDALNETAAEFDSITTEEAWGKFLEVSVKADAAGDMTTDDLQSLIEELNAVKSLLRMPDTDGASEETPVDVTSVIANADFELGANNGDWIWSKNAQNGPVLGNGINGQSFEFWNTAAADMWFDIHQSIVGLPVGKYVLAADLGNSYNSMRPEYAEGRANLYAAIVHGNDTIYNMATVQPIEENALTGYSNYSVEFTLTEAIPYDKVVVGVKSVGTMDARWICGDNFTLTYYGAGNKDVEETPVVKPNRLVVEPLESGRGKTVVLPIAMVNEQDITAFQFDIRLPKGVEFATELIDDEIEYSVQLDPARKTSTHAAQARMLHDGYLRVIANSSTSSKFKNSEGNIVNITLNISDEMAEGNYSILFKNIILVRPDGTEFDTDNMVSTLTISNSIPGDVNGDGRVSMGDVVSTINYILEKVPAKFDFAAADVNGDDRISMGDVVGIVNIILNDGTTRSTRSMGATSTDYLTMNGDAAAVNVALNNTQQYSAFQMDVVVPEGSTLESVDLSPRASHSHSVSWKPMADGKVRVIAYSMNGAEFSGNMGELVTFNLDNAGAKTRNISVENVSFVTTDGEEFVLEDCESEFGTDAVAAKVYAADGVLYVVGNADCQMPVYSVGGTVVKMLDVTVGVNRYDDIAPGAYIVNGVKVMIK